jgi:hypothetical protein
MKAGVLKLLFVVLAINLFFTYIGLYFLPQSESRPPKEIKLQEGISQDELIRLGEKIVFGKGQCMVCHPMKEETGMRAPAIATIGSTMQKEAEKKGISAEEYLFIALIAPSKHVAKGFDDIMPPVHKPPTSLNEGELIAVAAYLQSRGGKVTVSYPGSVKFLQTLISKEGGK